PCWAARYRWAAERGATFVALARPMYQRLQKLGIPADRLRLIRLGIDLAEHHFEPQIAPRRPRFVFVGRFVEKKGAETLIEAMAKLVEDRDDATLELVGAGPLEARLREQVGRLGLAQHVRFAGAVPFAQLLSHLRGATALV